MARVVGASGESPDFFVRYKVLALQRLGVQLGAGGAATILDFGGGVGQSSPHLRAVFPAARVVCADVSMRSLRIGRQQFREHADFVRFDGRVLPIADASVSIVFAACVFHHIPGEVHAHLFAEIARVLDADGALVIFEHNPLNPLTRRVVDQCPFDADATLLRASRLRRLLDQHGFATRLDYHLFFPRFARGLRPLEPHLSWLPAGAQYSIVARPSRSSTAAGLSERN